MVLASWLVGGVVLALIGHHREPAELTPHPEQLDAPAPEPAPEPVPA
jgi:hypothetical protein